MLQEVVSRKTIDDLEVLEKLGIHRIQSLK